MKKPVRIYVSSSQLRFESWDYGVIIQVLEFMSCDAESLQELSRRYVEFISSDMIGLEFRICGVDFGVRFERLKF